MADQGADQKQCSPTDIFDRINYLESELAKVKTAITLAHTELGTNISDLSNHIKDAKSFLTQALQRMDEDRDISHQEALDAVTATKETRTAIVELNTSLRSLSSQTTEASLTLRKDIVKSLSNAVNQLEAFIGINQYLSYGDLPLNYHGWPISADIGAFLIERINLRRYDVIIEFGSGTSTVLFARVIGRQKLQNQQKALHKAVSTHLVSFEHELNYLQKTKEALEINGILENVSLVPAPLTDWIDVTGSYLFYNCSDTLAKCARRLGNGQKQRILVLVDGPPGQTCRNARYPAIPEIYKHLGHHEIDVVLDDANRAEEQNIIELWRDYWSRNSIEVYETFVESEKGLYMSCSNGAKLKSFNRPKNRTYK